MKCLVCRHFPVQWQMIIRPEFKKLPEILV